ncbi:MAG: A24 family peptidase [Thermoguttaceae bacterium]
MNSLVYLPLAILGAAIGSAVNLAVYRLAWNQRSCSPWSAAPEGAPPRRPTDRIPIFGWLGLRREAPLHGAWFWIRPMLIEALAAAAVPLLYWWEVEQLALIRPMILPPSDLVLHVQFAVHTFLMALMLAGSLIDADEKTIPDGITVTGTLAGLALAAVFPWALLPDVVRAAPVLPDVGQMVAGGVAGAPAWDFLRLTAPNLWPPELDGFPRWTSLAIAAGCWWGWCFALMPRTWYGRHGWRRALQLSLARLRREGATYGAAAMGLVGTALVALVWRLGGPRWEGLLTALVGLAVGGAIIWSVRIIATAALHKEAMGFGDVTLMAMIGSFLGWQACLMIFFLAPFAGLVMGVASIILHRQPEIPYGPFLCLAAAAVMVWWRDVWLWAETPFMLAWILGAIFAVGLALMAGLLWLWRVLAPVLAAGLLGLRRALFG